MLPPLSREQSREIDVIAVRDYGLSTLVLMENAGREAARLLLSTGMTGPVMIVCGPGNNGGDGYVIARHLDATGIDVRLFSVCPVSALKGDARINAEICQRVGLPISERVEPSETWLHEAEQAWARADWLVDALLGTGFQGTPRENIACVIAAMNQSGRKIAAIDVPSGLDCDTGQAPGVCIRATRTITFVAPKIGFTSSAAQAYIGAVDVVPIGVPRRLLETMLPQDG